MEVKKGFSLIEVIIAVVIFLIIIIWVVDMFRNMNLEKRITLENAKLNENIMILEKNIKNYINEANLDLADNLNMLQSNLREIKPYFISSCVISPNIYESNSNRLIIYYNRNNVDLISVGVRNNNQVVFQSFLGRNFLIFNLVTNNDLGINRKFFWYFTIPQNLNFNPIDTIDVGRPIIYPNSNYNINLAFRRQSITDQGGTIIEGFKDIISQTHGNITRIDDVQLPSGGQFIGNPNLIYAEIRIEVNPRNGRSPFVYHRTLNFYVRHRSVI